MLRQMNDGFGEMVSYKCADRPVWRNWSRPLIDSELTDTSVCDSTDKRKTEFISHHLNAYMNRMRKSRQNSTKCIGFRCILYSSAHNMANSIIVEQANQTTWTASGNVRGKIKLKLNRISRKTQRRRPWMEPVDLPNVNATKKIHAHR